MKKQNLGLLAFAILCMIPSVMHAEHPAICMGVFAFEDEFEQWLDRNVVVHPVHWPRTDDWSWTTQDAADSWPSINNYPKHELELSFPFYALAGSNVQANQAGLFQRGANGEFDNYWRQLAQLLLQKGYKDCTIRLAWEFDGVGWSIWFAGNDPDAWAAYWRRIVDIFRSVEGLNYKFFWCGSPHQGYEVERAYPGDDYVDYVGFDGYDQNWTHYPIPAGATDDQKFTAWKATWDDQYYGARGMKWWADFAREHGKGLALGEWALMQRLESSGANRGGGDNPYFIQWMYDFLYENRDILAYHIYFNYSNTGDPIRQRIDGTVGAGDFPTAQIKFNELFGKEAYEAAVQIVAVNPPHTARWNVFDPAHHLLNLVKPSPRIFLLTGRLSGQDAPGIQPVIRTAGGSSAYGAVNLNKSGSKIAILRGK